MAKQRLTFELNADARRAVQGMNKFKRSVSSVAGSVAGIFGAGLGAAAVVSFTKHVIDLGDEIGKMSKRFGVGVEWIQRFKYMADLSGVSIGEIDRSLKKQAQTLYYASKGMQTYVRPLHDLGLKAKDLMKMKPEEAFEEIAKALQKVGNESKKAALAQLLWGRSGTSLLPMIKEFQQLKDQSDSAVIFSKEDIASAEAFKDAMTNIEKSITGFAVKSGLLEWLSDVADRMDKAVSLAQTTENAKKGGATGLDTQSGFQWIKIALAGLTGGWLRNADSTIANWFHGGSREMISTSNIANADDAKAFGMTLKEINENLKGNKRY